MDDEELREFIIPKLAEWKLASGRFKRAECIGCQIAWQQIQGWFDEKEKERLNEVAMTLSNSSSDKLSQCHPELQRLVRAVESRISLVVACGHRGETEQNRAFAEGKSKLKFPASKHNKLPSLAVDLVPLKRSKIDWNDKVLFYYFAGYVMAVAAMIDIKVRWGGNWNMNDDLHDQTFFDLVHFELRGV